MPLSPDIVFVPCLGKACPRSPRYFLAKTLILVWILCLPFCLCLLWAYGVMVSVRSSAMCLVIGLTPFAIFLLVVILCERSLISHSQRSTIPPVSRIRVMGWPSELACLKIEEHEFFEPRVHRILTPVIAEEKPWIPNVAIAIAIVSVCVITARSNLSFAFAIGCIIALTAILLCVIGLLARPRYFRITPGWIELLEFSRVSGEPVSHCKILLTGAELHVNFHSHTHGVRVKAVDGAQLAINLWGIWDAIVLVNDLLQAAVSPATSIELPADRLID